MTDAVNLLRMLGKDRGLKGCLDAADELEAYRKKSLVNTASFSLEAGQEARLVWPKNLSKEDVEDMIEWLELIMRTIRRERA